MTNSLRIGLIVPSSNTTMETEIPAMLRRRERVAAEQFTFHSSRMAMKRVSPEELARMDAESDRCARELSDADALVLSACVQMPSLPAIALAEKRFGLPVLSAATATTFQLLSRLGLEPRVPDAGSLLAEGVRDALDPSLRN